MIIFQSIYYCHSIVNIFPKIYDKILVSSNKSQKY